MDKMTAYSDLHYFVDYTYDTETDCDEAGCGNDSICRCGRIVDVEVKRITPTLPLAVHLVGRDDEILLYCVDRLLTHMPELKSNSSYDAEIEGGYYGEEMGPIKLVPEVAKKLDTAIEFLKQASNTERIGYVLVLENGVLLPKLKGLNWSIKRVALSKIKLPNVEHKDKLCDAAIKDYASCADCRNEIAQALVLERDGLYRVVDGYHRITAALKGKKEPLGNVLVLVGNHE